MSQASHLELGPLDGAVPSARKHARNVLREWGFENWFIETAELLVSELATNAVQASRALEQVLPSPIHLWLELGFHRVRVTVWDLNPSPPVLSKDVPAGAENGRGLGLVDFFAERWGWYVPQEAGGKSVWCEVTWESAARMPP